MVRAARGVLGTADEAPDCAAEAITQFLERHPTDVENLEAYLVAMSKRRAVDRIRRAQRARRRELIVGAQEALHVADLAEDVASRAEARWVAEQAAVLLRPDVLSLVELIADGVSLDDAAARLGWTKAATKSHLLRARRVMREAIARTLGTLGLLGAGLRRWAKSLTPAAGLATAALALLILPQVSCGPTPGAEPPVRLVPATRTADTPDLGTVGRVSVAFRRTDLSRHTTLPARSPKPPVTLARVQTPVAGAGVSQEEGTGNHGGFVARVLACAQHPTVTVGGTIGCDGS